MPRPTRPHLLLMLICLGLAYTNVGLYIQYMRETCTFFQVHSKKYISLGVKMTRIKGALCRMLDQLSTKQQCS